MTRAEYHALRRAQGQSMQRYKRHLLTCMQCGETLEQAKKTAPAILFCRPQCLALGEVGPLLVLQAKRRRETLERIESRRRWDDQRAQIESASVPEFIRSASLQFIGPRPAPSIRRIAA